MELDQIKKHAEDFQEKLKDKTHYDQIQTAMLARAKELELKWPHEIKAFSAEVHRLKGQKNPAAEQKVAEQKSVSVEEKAVE